MDWFPETVITWVREVFIVILSIAFLETLLPDGTMSKYVKFIFATMILSVLLEPIGYFVA